MLKSLKRFVTEEDRIGYVLLFCGFFCINMYNWGIISVLGFMGCNALYVIRTWKHEDQARLLRNSYLFLFLAVAFLSVAWSQYRGATLRACIQLAITMFIGVYLGSVRDPARVIFPIARALFVYVILSLVFGKIITIGNFGETGLTGFGGGAKNFFSDTTATCMILSIGCAAYDFHRRRYLKSALALFIVPLCAFALWRSNSAGGIVMSVLASLGLLYLLATARLPLMGKVIGAVMVASCGLFAYTFRDEITSMIFGAFRKDSTLTGRVYLWYRAGFYIDAKPLLGVGYYAFWQSPNVEAQGLWDYSGIKSRMGFNFHNTYIQLLVDLGVVGLIGFFAPMVLSVFRYVKLLVGKPEPLQLGALAFIAFEMMKSGVEIITPIPFAAQTTFIFMCLAISVAALERRDDATPVDWRRWRPRRKGAEHYA